MNLLLQKHNMSTRILSCFLCRRAVSQRTKHDSIKPRSECFVATFKNITPAEIDTKNKMRNSIISKKNDTDFQNMMVDKPHDDEITLQTGNIEKLLCTEKQVAENLEDPKRENGHVGNIEASKDMHRKSVDQAHNLDGQELEYACIKQTENDLTVNRQLVTENYDMLGHFPKPAQSENIYSKFEVPIEDTYNTSSTSNIEVVEASPKITVTDNVYDKVT